MFRHFYFLLIVRILLLVTSVFVLAFIFGDAGLMINHFILAVIICFQIAELIRYVNRTNRELVRLFTAVEHADFSITFQGGPHAKSFQALEVSLNKIIQAYKKVKIEREAQYHLLNMLVTQLNIGILAVQNDTEISLVNPACEKLLGVKGIRSWKILHQFNPEFTALVDELGENGRRLVELRSDGENKMLSIDVSTSNLLDKPHKLIIVQDINAEIEQKEIEAWHKLIRILTHEIMNSVTPISSLTETAQAMLENKDGRARRIGDLTDDSVSDMLFSLRTIQKRSDGLLNFVEAYRKLSRVPKPVLVPVEIAQLIKSVEKLMHEELVKNRIKVAININSNPTVLMDQALIEQVLINLITNSIHAVNEQENRELILEAATNEAHAVIEVRDNGRGISEKELSEIFVPFFSTRKEGSGIGLSLSKQIMNLHGGSIKVKSKPGEGTSFYLRFRI